MTRSACLIAPAYPLRDQQHLDDCLAAARRQAADNSWDLHLSPAIERFGGRGIRLPVADRVAMITAAERHDWLWAVRGGYGCAELIDDLAQWRPTTAPPLLGFSDLTTLHGYWQRRGWAPGIYGLMPAAPHGSRSRESLLRCLAGQTLGWSSADLPGRVLHPGQAAGPCFVACLRVLAAAVGSAAMPDLRGRILFLEDIDEAPYAIDRDCRQLAASGALSGVIGLVGGTFPWDDGIPYAGDDADTVLGAWARRLNIPCFSGLPFGHLDDPLCLPQEGRCELRVDERSWRLTITPPAFH